MSLHTPLRFNNGITAHNRLWLAPLTNQQSHPDGSLSDDELNFLQARARGGFSVIESCATHIALDGQTWPGELGIFDDRLIPDWHRLAHAIQTENALLFAQIFHGGERATPQTLHPTRNLQPWSAMASDDGRTRAATLQDIQAAITGFADAAHRAHQAGAHGVELHGAHGYLLGQFLSARNQRTDGWGTDFASRTRLLREATRAARAAVPDDFIIGVRLSPESAGQATGLDLDESLQTARWLAEDGANFIHISLWDAARNTQKYPDQHPIPLFRQALPDDIVLVAAGNVWTADEAQHLLDLGADAVALGRAAIVNPDWPRRIADPTLSIQRPPLTPAELLKRAVSPAFIDYLRATPRFGIVRDDDNP